ncbi:ABC transporter permease subunit [Paenibacillus sp. LMG 31458]|uniref:ABC transporter permease subunit n=1 Tax=Paenibacillus phytorum TaxID=2654977 RepID=A0ABX1Y7S4_9BACL|nr:carbohydrate ABC transporter permease [Paenibacillus phytorum]NOU76863.1 ABC transporter permease subunit [Paenibacillus phytorum]
MNDATVKRGTARWIIMPILLALGLIYIFPLNWMVITAFKTIPETVAFPPTWLPREWMVKNFADVWRTGPFDRYALNSFFVSVGIVLMELIVSISAAYTFAKKRVPGSKVMYALILSGMMIPMQVTVVPTYLLLSKLGWINTYAALIVPFLSSSMAIFLLTESFKQIPNELLEAAKIDRAPEWRIVWSIVLPYAKPTLVTIALLVFIAHWNDLFWVLVMTSSENLQTLTAGIMKLKDADGLQWNTLMAGNVLLVAPILLLYIAANQQIKSAFTHGGLK